MNLVLDAGALIAIDRQEREVFRRIELARRAGADLVTTAPVLGQAWRNGARQARLARLIATVDVRAVSGVEARAAGELLARSRTADVVDALLVGIVLAGDEVLTSDPEDLNALLAARGVEARIVTI